MKLTDLRVRGLITHVQPWGAFVTLRPVIRDRAVIRITDIPDGVTLKVGELIVCKILDREQHSGDLVLSMLNMEPPGGQEEEPKEQAEAQGQDA